MIHNEYLRKGDESYELFVSAYEETTHTYIKDGMAIIFKSLIDLIKYVFLGELNIKRAYIDIESLQDLYLKLDDLETDTKHVPYINYETGEIDLKLIEIYYK